MEIQRTLIDKDFDRYILTTEGVQKSELQLPNTVLEPLDAANTTRKSQWEARVHYNALTVDPFRSDALGASVAYYVDAEFRVVQAVCSKTSGLKVHPIFGLPSVQQRKENVTVQVAGKGLLVVNDGNGTLRIVKSSNSDADGAPWETVYEFQPLSAASTLLLKAHYDEQLQRFMLVLAEPLVNGEIEASFRVWVAEVSSAAASDSMDIDSGAVGLQHSVFEVAITSTLPNYIVFNGAELAVLVEGTCNLMIEAKNPVPVTPEPAHATKRHHDESDLEMDVDEVLAKVPRAGIGYHGDVSDVKHPHELGHDPDLAKPLAERFRKSSIPYSSLDEPLHSTSIEAVRSPTSQAREGGLEVPTPETILGGFEECDDMDPNAKAVLLLIDTRTQVVQDKLDINCRSFRFLGKSGSASASSVDESLLFQNDVHGLVFALDITASRLRLRHTTTFPAFGFVQASKQDKKYLTYDPSARFACIGEFEKRVFVYHGTPTEQEKTAHVRKQNVVEIGDHQLLAIYGHSTGGVGIRQSDMMLFHTRRMHPAARATIHNLSKTAGTRVLFQGNPLIFNNTTIGSLQFAPMHVFGSRSFSSGAPVPGFEGDKLAVATPIEAATAAINAATDLGFSQSDLAIRVLDAVHMTTGLPWWATLVATTFAVRTAMLPVTIKSFRNSEKMKAIQLAIEKLKTETDPAQQGDTETMDQLHEQYKRLVTTHNLTNLPHIFVFLGFFWGLPNMSKYFPDYTSGGNWWFMDLSVADPIYALPVISSALMIASMEMGVNAMSSNNGKVGMRIFGVLLIPLAATFQSGVLLFWVSSSLYTLAETAVFRLPAVRRALDL